MKTPLHFLLDDKRFELRYALNSNNYCAFSIIVVAHNSELTIYNHLNSLLSNATLPMEMILINDYSSDATAQEIERFISVNIDADVKLLYFETRIPIYESRCEDFAIRLATGEFIILVQADMRVHQLEYDNIMISALNSNPELFAISARGVHGIKDLSFTLVRHGREIPDSFLKPQIIKSIRFLILTFLKKFSSKRVQYSNLPDISYNTYHEHQHSLVNSSGFIFPKQRKSSAGFLGYLIDLVNYEYTETEAVFIQKHLGNVWLGETIMRGPMIFRKRDYLSLKGFNVKAFYQGLDDHDLMLRANQIGKTVGFSPIYFSSPTHLGSMRAKKTTSSRLWSKLHAALRRQERMKSELFVTLNKLTQ